MPVQSLSGWEGRTALWSATPFSKQELESCLRVLQDDEMQFGHSQPDALLADLQRLRDLGCNVVRGSHYPQDLRFLDLCDEAGVCVWSEAIGWQNTAAHLTDERFFFTGRRRACGLAIWLVIDFRTPASVARPRGFNDKGAVDECRRPKAAYAVVRRLFHTLQKSNMPPS